MRSIGVARKCSRVNDHHSDDPSLGDEGTAGCPYSDIETLTDYRSDRLDTVHHARPDRHEPVSLQTNEADFCSSLHPTGGHYIATPSQAARRLYSESGQVSFAGLQSCGKKFGFIFSTLILEERNNRRAVDCVRAVTAHHMIGRSDVEKTVSLTCDETKAVVGSAVRPGRSDPDNIATQLKR